MLEKNYKGPLYRATQKTRDLKNRKRHFLQVSNEWHIYWNDISMRCFLVGLCLSWSSCIWQIYTSETLKQAEGVVSTVRCEGREHALGRGIKRKLDSIHSMYSTLHEDQDGQYCMVLLDVIYTYICSYSSYSFTFAYISVVQNYSTKKLSTVNTGVMGKSIRERCLTSLRLSVASFFSGIVFYLAGIFDKLFVTTRNAKHTSHCFDHASL